MKNLNKTSENAAPSGKKSEISQKKEVNIPKNSSLYFQIGLILCLLATYGLFEMNFQMKLPVIEHGTPPDDSDIFTIGEIIIEPDAPKPVPQERQVAMVITKPPIVMPDTYSEIVPALVTPASVLPTTVPVNPNTSEAQPNPTPPIKSGPMDLNKVEKVPVFPGCESAKNNTERLQCMSDKLAKLIQRKFNTDLAADLGLEGVQKIQVQFKINEKGQVTDIKTRSPYSQLEKEAERVVSNIPKMKPGMQRETPVSVIYNLPIAFQVH